MMIEKIILWVFSVFIGFTLLFESIFKPSEFIDMWKRIESKFQKHKIGCGYLVDISKTHDGKYQPRIKIGNQSFKVDYKCETIGECVWMNQMLHKALMKISGDLDE